MFYLFTAGGIIGLVILSYMEAFYVFSLTNTSKKLEKMLANITRIAGFLMILTVFVLSTDSIKTVSLEIMGEPLHFLGLFLSIVGLLTANGVWCGITIMWVQNITHRDRILCEKLKETYEVAQ